MSIESTKQSAYLAMFPNNADINTKQSAYIPIFDLFARFSQQSAYVAMYPIMVRKRRRAALIIN